MRFEEPGKLNRNPGGWGTRLFTVLLAVPNTNGGLIENLFLRIANVEWCREIGNLGRLNFSRKENAANRDGADDRT